MRGDNPCSCLFLPPGPQVPEGPGFHPCFGFSLVLLGGASQADLSKLYIYLGVAFCLPKGCRIEGIIAHQRVKFDMFQLIAGQKKEEWGWRRDNLEGEKYRALMSSTK